jgi:hypothetical protein
MSDDKCSDSFSISIVLPCFWIDSTCYVFTLALRHWRRGTGCDRAERNERNLKWIQ